MTNTQRLLDLLRRKTDAKTWYATAKALGMPPASIYRYVNHPNTLPIDYAWPLSAALGMDLGEVIAYIEMETAKNDAQRARWIERAGKLATKFRGAAMVALAIGAGFLGVLHTNPAAAAAMVKVYYG